MILALLLVVQDLASSVATKPVPIDPASWVTDNDYPAEALRRDEFGTVRFALLVDATGKVTRCNVLATSGFAVLDQTACAAMLQRARFKPARDAAGQPIVASYQASFSWVIPGGPDPRKVAREPVPGLDMLLTLKKVPKAYTQPALLRVHFNAARKPDACRVELSSGSAALDKVACERAMVDATPPADTLKWNRVPDTAMVTVSFEGEN